MNKSISNARNIDQKVVVKNLNNLFEDDSNPDTLGILLDHFYTEQSLSDSGIRALKGIDNERYSVLAQANKLLPSDKQLVFYICQANLSIDYYNYSCGSEIKESYELSDEDLDSGTESEHWEQGRKCFELVDWHDTNGKILDCDRSYIEQAMKKKEFFIGVLNPSIGLTGLDDIDTWGRADRVRIGYLGNQAAEKDYEYKKYMLVSFPRNRIGTLIAVDIESALDLVYRMVVEEKSPTDSEMRCKIEKISSSLCENNLRAKKLPAKCFSQAFHLLTVFNMQVEFESVLDNCTIKINEECAKRLGLAVSQFGFDSLKTTLENFLNPCVSNFTSIFALIQVIYQTLLLFIQENFNSI